jgi:hypothetical protein
MDGARARMEAYRNRYRDQLLADKEALAAELEVLRVSSSILASAHSLLGPSLHSINIM